MTSVMVSTVHKPEVGAASPTNSEEHMRHFIRFMATAMIILMAACNDDASTGPEDPIIEGTAQGKVILPAGSAIALS